LIYGRQLTAPTIFTSARESPEWHVRRVGRSRGVAGDKTALGKRRGAYGKENGDDPARKLQAVFLLF